MYDELMPLWKARCQAFRTNDLGGVFENKCIKYLNEKGIYHPLHAGPQPAKQVGIFEWLDNNSGHSDLLVLGVMLFTWEQGISE